MSVAIPVTGFLPMLADTYVGAALDLGMLCACCVFTSAHRDVKRLCNGNVVPDVRLDALSTTLDDPIERMLALIVS